MPGNFPLFQHLDHNLLGSAALWTLRRGACPLNRLRNRLLRITLIKKIIKEGINTLFFYWLFYWLTKVEKVIKFIWLILGKTNKRLPKYQKYGNAYPSHHSAAPVICLKDTLIHS
ncbi:MAG TPA: hypothetical protein ENN84_01220 [Candidatus Marinimicrobia bacterium]|nr:hypothetical protein [Candidatus Neomarinimicrobiota bacterium]